MHFRIIKWIIVLVGLLTLEAQGAPTTQPTFSQELNSARAGDARAMVEVGEAYARGVGVGQDYGHAMDWFRKSAGLGNAEAMNQIGNLYFTGSGISRGPGVPQDYSEAMKWFRMAADRGNAGGMFGVGTLYASGFDVQQDDAEARKWITMSARAGYAPARDWLANHGAVAGDGEIGWTTWTGLDHQIFPSLIVSTSRDDRPLFAHYLFVKLMNVPVGARYHLEAKCDSVMDDITVDGTVPADLVIPLKVSWRFDELGKIREQTPVDFSYSLQINGRDLGEKTDSVVVHSINDCVFHFRDYDGRNQAYYRGFAAYVNEESPKIDKLLDESLSAGVIRAFDGYQENDPKAVVLQVYAIWHALQQRGVKYSSIAELPTPGDELVQAQHVRFVDESIDDAQANCVDGSIVFASVLKKVGIDSALAITPEHCFIVFFTSPGEQNPVALETTLLGSASFDDQTSSSLHGRTWEAKASRQTFMAAMQAGADEFNKLASDLKDQTSNPTGEFVGVVVPISAARRLGIMPIPTEYASDAEEER